MNLLRIVKLKYTLGYFNNLSDEEHYIVNTLVKLKNKHNVYIDKDANEIFRYLPEYNELFVSYWSFYKSFKGNFGHNLVTSNYILSYFFERQLNMQINIRLIRSVKLDWLR